MKRVIIRFTEPVTAVKCEVYYKEIPKILARYYYRKLARKGCWNIEIIEPEELWKKFKTRCYPENVEDHIPRID